MAKAVVLKQKQIAIAAEKGKFGENRLAWWWMEKILKHTEFGQHFNQQINQLWMTPWTAMEGQKPASPDDASPPPGLTPLCCRPCIRPKLSQLVLSILKVLWVEDLVSDDSLEGVSQLKGGVEQDHGGQHLEWQRL